MAQVRVSYDDKKLRRNLKNFDSNLSRSLAIVTDRRAAITEGELKQRAPWTDDTGAARAGLMAIPNHGPGFIEILMTYSVDYGIWLEIANNRKYAVIGPMMRIAGDALMKDLQNLIEHMERMT